MRGILFIGGQTPEPATAQSIARNADIIVAADSGLIAAEAAGIKPDWIVGDMDSFDDELRLDKYPPDRIIRYSPDKDYTDTELGLRLLWDHACTHTVIIGGGGGRLDHLFALRSLFEREPCPDIWITNAEALYCIKGAGLKNESKRLTLHTADLVSIFPLGDGPWRIQSTGLKWPLDSLAWNRGFFGISNIAESGTFSVCAEHGKFLVLIQSG